MFSDDDTVNTIDNALESEKNTISSEAFQDNGAMNDSDSKFNGISDLKAAYDIPVQVSAVLGRANMPVNHLLKLGRGAVIELDRRVGDSIEIMVNNKLVAKGEVVVVNNHLGVTMTEIMKSDSSD